MMYLILTAVIFGLAFEAGLFSTPWMFPAACGLVIAVRALIFIRVSQARKSELYWVEATYAERYGTAGLNLQGNPLEGAARHTNDIAGIAGASGLEAGAAALGVLAVGEFVNWLDDRANTTPDQRELRAMLQEAQRRVFRAGFDFFCYSFVIGGLLVLYLVW